MTDANLVDPADACPECGERDADWLEWMNDEDGQVRCASCWFTYSPDNHPHALADEHEDACYEDEGEAAFGYDD